MPRLIRVLLCTALIASTFPGLIASATETTPPSPVWGGGILDDGPGPQLSPRIDGGVVVWDEITGAEVRFHDFRTDASGPVYADGVSQESDVSGDIVVWSEQSIDPLGDIWMKDLSSDMVSEVATRTDAGERVPRVDGDIIVWSENDATGYHLVGVDLSVGTTFTVSLSTDIYDGAVSDGRVAFTSEDQVYVYDIAASTVTTICDEPSTKASVSIDGDVVVWADDRGADWDIYAYDLTAALESQVCGATGDQLLPSISGDLIVWQDKRGGADFDVYAYDLSTSKEWPIVVAAGNQQAPDTDGSHIVWVDSRNAPTSGEDIWWVGYDTIAPTTTSDVQPSYNGVAEISLAAEDNVFGSGVYKTWYKVDYVGSWYEGPFSVVRPGHHTLHYKSYDNVENLEAYNVEYFDVVSVNTTYTAIQGPNRYDTAVATSQEAFPKGADCVIIATGENWPDALGGAALAKAKHAAILLTLPTALPEVVLEEIERLDVCEAIILGGVNAVSADVEATLVEKLGDEKVTRVEGQDRYETADMVARATREAMGYSPYKVLVATGQNFPDALGASPLAALGPWPLVLAPPGEGLTEGTKQTITDIGSGYGVILGGEQAVSEQVVTELEEMFGEGRTTRLAGEDRYATSVECAKFGVAHGLWWDGVALSTGANFPDALAGGMLQGQAGSVLLLTPSDALHEAVADELTAQRDWIGNVTFLGGTAAVSQDVRDAVAGILK